MRDFEEKQENNSAVKLPIKPFSHIPVSIAMILVIESRLNKLAERVAAIDQELIAIGKTMRTMVEP